MNIDLNQVFHLHNSVDRPITVVYKSCILKISLKWMRFYRLMRQAMSRAKTVWQQVSDEVYNMSTDVFIVDTPWLIEKNRRRSQEEYPQKLRYILRDLAVEYQCFAFEYTGYLANIHSVESYCQANLDMLENQKFMKLFHQIKKCIRRWRMENQRIIPRLHINRLNLLRVVL